MSNQSNIDSLVFDFFLRGAETVIRDRKAHMQPMSSSSSDCSEYIRQTVQSWKRQLSRPMNIDLYIFNNVVNSHVLMERWNFTYTYSLDSAEICSQATVNQRIQVLTRSLYSFLRLLPGFNLLHCSQFKPLLTMQIYDPKISPEAFPYESSSYSFPSISTSKGLLSMSVSFTSPGVVKDILRAINGGSLIGLPSPSVVKIEKVDSRQHSASIPIPGRAPPVDPYRARVYSDSRDSRRSFKDESNLTAMLRAEYAQGRSFESRSGGGDLGGFFPSSVGSSGASKTGGGLVYPNQFAGSSDGPHGSSPSSNSGKVLLYGQPSSLPNNMSFQASTPPPFAYLPMFDPASSGNMELPRASPPYYQISSSLNSASPHLGPNLSTVMERRYSWRKSGSAAPVNPLSSSLRTEALIAAVEQEMSKMKVSLPPSPFVPTSTAEDAVGNNDTINNQSMSATTNATLVSAGTTFSTAGELFAADNVADTFLQSTAKSVPNNKNNNLDIVAKYEKERERRNSDLYLYDSNPNSRTVSISETTRDRDEDTTDTALMDDDVPFATFRPSYTSSSSTGMVNPMSGASGGTTIFPITTISSSSAAAMAPVLAIVCRSSNSSGTCGIGNTGAIINTTNKGNTMDGMIGSGIPLPTLAQDLQRHVFDHKQFLQQYATVKGISLTSPSHAPATNSRGASAKN